ncbi:putative RNA-binding protein RbpE [Gracilariopsis chorda]|uniref:Putative RNA-binding protein RbpE n=1 Tax=Gracilariopsis chorda TaxID=448386 RepID=A0A2V3IXK3_9FLOR|nr:putative RNA-binding protein RbpE [Gracilariopsis chorda]|eukprot:PXF46872.1 putative RNA-binding protein RbpE [Gracilariopsis chorda]
MGSAKKSSKRKKHVDSVHKAAELDVQPSAQVKASKKHKVKSSTPSAVVANPKAAQLTAVKSKSSSKKDKKSKKAKKKPPTPSSSEDESEDSQSSQDESEQPQAQSDSAPSSSSDSSDSGDRAADGGKPSGTDKQQICANGNAGDDDFSEEDSSSDDEPSKPPAEVEKPKQLKKGKQPKDDSSSSEESSSSSSSSDEEPAPAKDKRRKKTELKANGHASPEDDDDDSSEEGSDDSDNDDEPNNSAKHKGPSKKSADAAEESSDSDSDDSSSSEEEKPKKKSVKKAEEDSAEDEDSSDSSDSDSGPEEPGRETKHVKTTSKEKKTKKESSEEHSSDEDQEDEKVPMDIDQQSTPEKNLSAQHVGQKRKQDLDDQNSQPFKKHEPNVRPSDDLRVFVGGVPFSITEDELGSYFSECGEITDLFLPRDRETDRIRGFAFISFANNLGAKAAMELDGSLLKGRHLRVNPAGSKPGGGSRGGGPRGRGAPRGGGRGGRVDTWVGLEMDLVEVEEVSEVAVVEGVAVGCEEEEDEDLEAAEDLEIVEDMVVEGGSQELRTLQTGVLLEQRPFLMMTVTDLSPQLPVDLNNYETMWSGVLRYTRKIASQSKLLEVTHIRRCSCMLPVVGKYLKVHLVHV